MITRSNRCVDRPRLTCREPARANRRGTACICPRGMQRRGNGCIERRERRRPQEREQPRRSLDAGDLIRVLPGLIDGLGPRGGPRGTPGRGHP
jgi:hypothetical protein